MTATVAVLDEVAGRPYAALRVAGPYPAGSVLLSGVLLVFEVVTTSASHWLHTLCTPCVLSRVPLATSWRSWLTASPLFAFTVAGPWAPMALAGRSEHPERENARGQRPPGGYAEPVCTDESGHVFLVSQWACDERDVRHRIRLGRIADLDARFPGRLAWMPDH